jgi:hypothetical protein
MLKIRGCNTGLSGTTVGNLRNFEKNLTHDLTGY